MREPVQFTIPGRPVAWARARINRAGKHYTDDRTRAYKTMVGTLAKIAMRGGDPFAGGVLLNISVVMTPPSILNKKQTEAAISGGVAAITGQDVDNFAKAVMDAMNEIVYRDDRQITSLTVTKSYGREPHVRVAVYEQPSAYFQA
jgi:Holliday junction resolvase RusA-like endonuclease